MNIFIAKNINTQNKSMQKRKICRCLTNRKCTSHRDHWTMADIPDNDDKNNNSTNNEAEGRQEDYPSSTEYDTDTDTEDGSKPSKEAKKGKNEWKGVPDDSDIQVHPENNASADNITDGSKSASMKDIENIDTDIEIKKLEVERLEIQELIGIHDLDREYQGKIEALTFEYATKKKALAYEYGEKTLAAQMEILDLEILKLTLGEEDTPPFQMYK